MNLWTIEASPLPTSPAEYFFIYVDQSGEMSTAEVETAAKKIIAENNAHAMFDPHVSAALMMNYPAGTFDRDLSRPNQSNFLSI